MLEMLEALGGLADRRGAIDFNALSKVFSMMPESKLYSRNLAGS